MTLVTEDDAEDRKNGKKLKEMKKDACARLCKEAYEQGGCLTQTELAILFKISTPTVSKYIAEWEMDTGIDRGMPASAWHYSRSVYHSFEKGSGEQKDSGFQGYWSSGTIR